MLDKVHNELREKLDRYFATLEGLLRGAEVTDRSARRAAARRRLRVGARRGA